ncbi:MAG TPA: methyltransferase domain-containing protein [Chloroflexota bacterium]|nr:methyltransferase domain-containing protein [Chloroflexota bacterium]
MALAEQPVLDSDKLQAFVNKAVGDWGSLTSATLLVIGDELNLYGALTDDGPATPTELAQRTGTAEPYVHPWLVNQAAGGYLDFDATTGRYSLPPEHAAALGALSGRYQMLISAMRAEPRITEAFRTGQGMHWGEHDTGLFSGVERFFRPSYEQFLVQEWIPALEGVQAKLERGALVADVGCGHGASTIILARAYPNSTFLGFDNHAPSIERARRAAAEAGIADRLSFEVAPSSDFPSPLSGYDLVAFFDCLHDMGDPTAALRRATQTLAPGGTVMLVEPMAGETDAENHNPVGRVYSGASVLICTPHAIAESGHALGTIASDATLRGVAAAAGLSHFRRATATPFNRIFEARV